MLRSGEMPLAALHRLYLDAFSSFYTLALWLVYVFFFLPSHFTVAFFSLFHLQ